MTLAAGTRLGSYEVSTLLGAGGMGEVYRARDPRLGRDVAIKVLPAAFAADPDRLRRFEQEARAAATISHPNILVVYDVGVFHPPAPSEASGFGNDARPSSYLVSELLDGETLAARLRRGPLTVRRAVECVVQIAHGLAAAHEKGILHRDLKPANIFVTTDERAKILDFGLAKLTESPEGTGELSLLTATLPGVVLGTVGYMSPEQVRGQTIDQRSDIFAVGVLLFEMLSGRRAFPGNTAADAVSAILAEDRPRLPASERQIPATLVRIVDRCLEKAPAARFQTATDLAFALEGLLSASDHAPSSSPAPGKPHLLPWLVATTVLCLVALGLTAILYLRGPADEDAVFHSTILPPGELSVSLSPHFSLSPNGRLLAMIAPDPSHRRMLWIRPLDGPAAQALAGTEDAEAPFWSPDSRTVAFVADGRLKRIDAAGGPVVTVAESAFTAPGAWNRDDVILFTARQPSTLSRVPAAGGTPVAATALATAGDESIHAHPFFLPDSRHFLYAAWSSTKAPLGVRIGSLDSAEGAPLLEGVANAQYARGALLFVRGSTLMEQAFDATRRAFVGDPVPIANQLSIGRLRSTDAFSRAGAFSVSETGVLVYQTAPSPASRLVWFDRDGRELGAVGDTADYGDLLLSPDDQRVSVSIDVPGGGNRDIWVFDAVRGVGSRATFDSGNELEGVWSPDGRRLVYNSNRAGRLNLYQRAASGAGEDALVLESAVNKYVQSWSPDGKFLLFVTPPGPNPSFDLWTLPLSGERTPRPFLQTPFDEGRAARFSPDGRWVSYQSDESGRLEVYMTPFPADPSRKQRISTAGGTTARWAENGREILYYEPGSSRLQSVPLTYRGDAVEIGAVKPLFKVRPNVEWALWYDVSRDGQRFLVNTLLDQGTPTPLTLVVNWRARPGR